MGKHALAPSHERNKRCLTKEQAAEYLSVSPKSIDRMIQDGRIPIVKLDLAVSSVAASPRKTNAFRRVLIDVRDLDRLIDEAKINEHA